jgi:putative endonuclease
MERCESGFPKGLLWRNRLACPNGGPLAEKMFYAYILRSLSDGKHYYGSTKDLQNRLKVHNAGRVRYTKGHLAYVIHYTESFETGKEALARERFFKSIDGHKWLKSAGII